MRTQTVCCGSTSPKAPTCRAGPLTNSRPSLTRSTTGHERSSGGRRPLKSSRSNYARFNKSVLHQPVELAQYASKEFAQVCEDLGVVRSRGAVGTSADNAAAESLNASLKRETLQGKKRWTG